MNVDVRLFEDYSASSLNFRKYHHMRHARESVEEHASLAIYNTGADEMAHKEGPKVSRRFRRPIRRHIKRLNRPRCRFALATRTSGRLINSCSVTLQCARLCGCLWRTPRFFRVVRRHTSLNMRPRWFRYLIRPSNIRYFDGLICL